MKRLLSCFLCILLFLTTGTTVFAVDMLSGDDIQIDAPSAILMEKVTGNILYEKNANEKMSPASVTKVMTMLLVMEELEKGTLTMDTMVTTSAKAAGMGGSQIFLEEGEQMSVHDMLKSVAVSSANDCAVALAEHIAGTEEAFAARMNTRAAELGMENTNFINCSGLTEDPSHFTTAYDIAVMSRELIAHDKIKEYTTIWMDTVRNGDFGLNNTNKLIYYYDGATGLKTGFTRNAMYCLSATAERDGVEYIAVIMHGATSAERFESAKTLLNYAFANYTLSSQTPDEVLPPIPVELGTCDVVQPIYGSATDILLPRNVAGNITKEIELPEKLSAPIKDGDTIGYLHIISDGKTIEKIPIVSGDEIPRMTKWQIFAKFICKMSGAY